MTLHASMHHPKKLIVAQVGSHPNSHWGELNLGSLLIAPYPYPTSTHSM